MSDENVDIVVGPRVESRGELLTLGIREVVPFRGMLSHRDRLLAELVAWLRDREVEPSGPFFLRLHVVDMAGSMDIEVGVVTTAPTDDDRVTRSSLPAGRYALLDYRRTSLPANRLILTWIRQHGLMADSHDSPTGEVFAARCEIYQTDPRTEPRKTTWVVQLAFLLRD